MATAFHGYPDSVVTDLLKELILEKLAGGLSWDEILKSYPRLQREDIAAALEFAAQSLRADAYVPTRSPSP